MGEKLFAVPWEALKLDTTNKRFELDVKKSGWRVRPASTRTSGPTWPTSRGKRVFMPITARSPTASHRASEAVGPASGTDPG